MPAAPQKLSSLAKVNLAALLLLVVTVSVLLWPQWTSNPDLSHGVVMPVIFFFLLRESRSAGYPRYPRSGGLLYGALVALTLLGLCALMFTGLYAAAVDWSHTLVALFVGLSLVCFLSAGLLAFSNDTLRLIPFNWTSCVAIFLWFLSVPIPPGSYSRLTLALQFFVTGRVLETLHLLGISATRMGNVIEMASVTVGIEEACSGIRSLISCVFAGFFFSATLLNRTWSRIVIIVLAPLLAILMNFFRSLTLTLLASSKVNINGFWHDFTGFAVLGLTAALLFFIAWLLGRAPQTAGKPGARATSPGRFGYGQVTLFTGLFLASLTTAFFAVNSFKPADHTKPVPDLAALLPERFDGWDVQTSTILYQFADILQTSHLVQRSYVKPAPDGMTQITFYFAYWRPGQAPVSLVAMHTPDACWPGAGWVQVDVPDKNPPLSIDSHLLPMAEARHFKSGEYPQYVWFWHMYAGRAITHIDPYSPRRLLQIAWKYGFQSKGDQLFVRVSSNRPWDEIQADPLVKEVFHRLARYGL